MSLVDVLALGGLGFVVWQVAGKGGNPLGGLHLPPISAPQPSATPTAPQTLAQATNALQVTADSWCAVNASTRMWHAHVVVNHRGQGSDGGIWNVYLVGTWAEGSFLGQTIGQGQWQTVAQQQLPVGPDSEWASYGVELIGPYPSGSTATALARAVVQDLDGNVYDTRDVPTHWGQE